MRWSLAVVALVSACGSEGVEIEVDVGATGATQVELFLTTGDCPDCPAVGPQGEQKPLTPNSVYLRDAVGRYRADVDGDGVARFWLREGPGGTAVPFAIAVGFAGDGGERSEVGVQKLAIDASAGRVIYKTTLDPAKPRLGRDTDGVGTFVQVWHTGDAEACVIVEDDKGTSSTYVSIVPEGDRDCDGVTGAAECSANVYQFAAPPPGDLKQSTCMLRAPTASGVACRLGGGCVDGGARCEPTHACIPDPFCDCGLDDLACLLQTAATPGFRIDCTVPTNNGQLCESPSDTLRIYVPPFMQTATECGNIRFNRLPRPGQPLVPPLFDPQSSLQFDDGARVDLNDNLGAGCNFTLKTVSVPPLTNGTPARDHALTILEASNGFTVVVPLDLTFVSQGCGMTSTNCVFLGPDAMNVNADSMWNCLRVPPP